MSDFRIVYDPWKDKYDWWDTNDYYRSVIWKKKSGVDYCSEYDRYGGNMEDEPFREPHQLDPERKVLLLDRNEGVVKRNGKYRKRKRKGSIRKLVYEPMSDSFYKYKVIDSYLLLHKDRVKGVGKHSWVHIPIHAWEDGTETWNIKWGTSNTTRKKGEGGDGYIDRSIELMKEHPMYPKLKQYETELGRDLSFHEMQSHCLYETDGLLEKEQKQIQKEYRYHTAVLEFKEFIENEGFLDDKDRYLDNGYGYLVLYGNK